MSNNDIAPSVIINPQELTQHPLNSNTHPQWQIEALAASRDILGQYQNIVLWESGERLEVESKGKAAVLESGVKYVLAGNGLLQAAILRGEKSIEVKDRSDLTFEELILLMETDNASPLGSKPDPVRMQESWRGLARMGRRRRMWGLKLIGLTSYERSGVLSWGSYYSKVGGLDGTEAKTVNQLSLRMESNYGCS